ncbi:hypothetical protein FS837_006447 [Tulasnella sp. UAMH 9824]|nr:hypothetical protein FS837_006447 [Tulasnella sp. UAMH 9824]
MVQHLGLDLEWIDSWEIPQDQNPSILQPDGMKALSLTKNLHSLCLWGVDDWIWEPTQARYRETIFNMKLARLEIPVMTDVKVRWSCSRPRGPDAPPEWDGDLGAEIRKLLQAQPLLEEFALTETKISHETLSSLEDSLQSSDIPKLKSLEATPDVVAAFVSAGPRLESLNLLLASWNEFVFSKLSEAPTAARLSVQRYSIRVWYSDEWLWSHLAKVFALFPNVEHLSVAINSLTSSKEVEYAKHYFDKVASSMHVLPLIRSVKVRYETLYPETAGIFEVGEDAIAELKMSYPLLETIINPKGEMWGFPPRDSSVGVPKVIGRIGNEWNEWQNDLPLVD